MDWNSKNQTKLEEFMEEMIDLSDTICQPEIDEISFNLKTTVGIDFAFLPSKQESQQY